MSANGTRENDAARCSPGIVTARPRATCEFYETHFGFRRVPNGRDRVLLVGPGGMKLELLQAGAEEEPAALQAATRGSGFWITLEVVGVDALFARLRKAGVEIVTDLKPAPAEETCFTVRDPNGVLIHIMAKRRCALFSTPQQYNDKDHDHNHRHSVHRLSSY